MELETSNAAVNSKTIKEEESTSTGSYNEEKGKNRIELEHLKLCTYNIRTTNSNRLNDLLEAVKGKEYHVIALQETKSAKKVEKYPDGTHIILGDKVSSGNIGGMGFVVHPSIVSFASCKMVSPRLAILRLRLPHQQCVSIINCYSPTLTANHAELDDFYKDVEKAVRDEKSYFKFVVGDFNARIGKPIEEGYRIGKFGYGPRNANGNRLVELLYTSRLFHGNSIFMDKKELAERWTWESPENEMGYRSYAENDHILANRRYSIVQVSVVEPFTFSDHRPIVADVRICQKWEEAQLLKPLKDDLNANYYNLLTILVDYGKRLTPLSEGKPRETPKINLQADTFITQLLRMSFVPDTKWPPSISLTDDYLSCLGHIQTISRVIEVCGEYKEQPLVLTFVDYKNAFSKLVNCHKYRAQQRQSIFAAFLQCAVKSVNWSEKGIRVGNRFLSHLCFENNIVVFSSSVKDAEDMLMELNEAGKMLGLCIHSAEIQFMRNETCKEAEKNVKMKFEGSWIAEKCSYIYLGRSMNMTNDLTEELIRREEAGWAAFELLVEATDRLTCSELVHLFKSTVVPEICYAAETWTETKDTQRALRSIDKRLHRRLCECMRRARQIDGFDVEEEMANFYSLGDYISEARYRWASVIAKSANSWTLRTLEWEPKGAGRFLGRPTKRWRDVFEKRVKSLKIIASKNEHALTLNKDTYSWITLARHWDKWNLLHQVENDLRIINERQIEKSIGAWNHTNS